MASRVKAGQAYVELTLNDKLSRSLDNTSKKLNQFGDTVRNIGTAFVGLGVAAATPFAFATRTFTLFSDKMQEVRAITAATEVEFISLNNTAKELGRTTSFTATQVAEGMAELGRAGFDATQIISAIPEVLALSRATATELGLAATIAGNALKGFNLEAEDTARVADVLTATANNSAQGLEDIGNALAYVAPIAADAGETIEDVGTGLAILANNAIKGSAGGNALARAYKNLATVKAQDTLKGIGVEVDNGVGGFRKLSEILVDLGKQTESLGSIERLGIFESLFGRASAAASKLAQAEAQFEDLGNKIKSSGGIAKQTADIMDSGLGGAFRILDSAIEGVSIAVGRSLAPALKTAAENFTQVAGQATAWVEANGETVTASARAVVALTALGAGLLAVSVAAKGAALSFGAMSLVFTAGTKIAAALTISISFLKAQIVLLRAASLLSAGSMSAMAASFVAAKISAFTLATGITTLTGVINLATLAAFKFIALPIAVALAGFKIGEAIAEWTGLSRATQTAYNWLFDVKELSDEEIFKKQLDSLNQRLAAGKITAEEYKRQLEALNSVRLKGVSQDDQAGSGEKDKAEEDEKSRKRALVAAEQERKIEDAKNKIQEANIKLTYDGIEQRKQLLGLEKERAIDAAEGNKELISQITQKFIAESKLLDLEKQRADVKASELEEEQKVLSAKSANEQKERDIQDLALTNLFQGVELEQRRLELAKQRAIEEAKALGENVALVEREFALRERLLSASIAAKNADREKTIQDLVLEAQFKGVELEEKKLELAKQRAIEEAKAAGTSIDLVEKEFALREQIANQIKNVPKVTTEALGTFSASSISQAFGSRSGSDEVAENTKQLVTETKETNKILAAQKQLAFN